MSAGHPRGPARVAYNAHRSPIDGFQGGKENELTEKEQERKGKNMKRGERGDGMMRRKGGRVVSRSY